MEEETAIAEVLRSGWIVGGARLQAFERAFAKACDAGFAVATSSWTTGAFLVLKSWGIGPGDEVIVPSLTFIATVNAITHTGATPVFADVDAETWTMSPADATRKITPRTRALLPVDQLGMPCDLPAFSRLAEQHGLRLLDDAACAFGSRVGNWPVGAFGDAAIFSLHARKVITTGEGGMIVTNDKDLHDRLKRLRHQGMSVSDFARHGQSPAMFESYPEVGYNFRLTDIQAAMGLAQLARAQDILARRAALAERYTAALLHHPVVRPPTVPAGVTPNWQSYQVTLRDETGLTQKDLLEALFRRGIHARRGVMAAHLEPAYAHMVCDLPVTTRAAQRTLQLPLYPDLSFEEQDRVLAALDAAPLTSI
jgi:perosamine synthetase